MNSIKNTIMQLEITALERWNAGDPSGYLEISAKDVTYFDPFLEKRLDGWDALSAWYEGIRGQIKVDKYELINPQIQVSGNIAVLTFNLVSYTGNSVSKWNCTEVYRFENDSEWKLIHTHWSYVSQK
jgi:ketosteroid isomerase-like protein